MATFETESNDTINTASEGIFNTAVNGQLSSTTDVDLYRFDFTQNSVLTVKFSGDSLAYKFKLLDANGGLVFSNTGGISLTNGVNFGSLGPGTYYISVEASSDLTKFTTDQYSISLTTQPSIEVQGEQESNDTINTASLVEIGHGTALFDSVTGYTILGNLSGASDKDYLKFNLDQPGRYIFKFTPTDNGKTADQATPDANGAVKDFFKISIIAADQTTVLETHYTNSANTFDFKTNTSGLFYILIENGGSTTNINTLQYNLDINPDEAGDGSVSVTGGSFADYLLGTSSSDVIVGNEGNDILLAKQGNDSIDGGKGADTMIGGTGNDIYVVDSATDKIIENTGEGEDRVISSVNYTLGNNLENLVLTDNAKIGIGNSLDNVIIGNDQNNTLKGNAGNDTIDGKGSATGDILAGGLGDDQYFINSERDIIQEAAAQGTDLAIYTVNITHTLNSFVENLQLIEANGLIYAKGNDLSNTIIGNNNDNQMYGLGGNDSIAAGGGNDALVGGAGNDTLQGGPGSDIFVFDTALNATTNVDTIVDFASESGDMIHLSSLIFASLKSLSPADHIGSDNFLVTNHAPSSADLTTSKQFIVYDQSSGDLYYDADGNGAAKGLIKFAHLASLDGGISQPTLHNTDISIV